MLSVDRTDNITTISLAHGKVNVMDLELCRAVTNAFREETDGHGIILTGKGSAFSAGVDLLRLVNGGSGYVDDFLTALVDMFLSVFNHPGPVVAAVNGHAIAGGCVIAAACDHRIMAQGKGRIGIPELQIGVPFPVEALEIMRFMLPSRFLSEVVYGGGMWVAGEARERGVVNEVCESVNLLTEADRIVRRMAAVPAGVFALSKRQLHQPVLDAIERLQGLNEEVVAVWTSSATQEIIRSYLERTIGKS